MKPYVLITNDDGIDAKGIKHLYEAVSSHLDCIIVAPVIEKSGAGLSITLTKPLQIKKVNWPDVDAYKINGTPSDCVKLALSVILKKKPDLIISGINQGSNAGRNLLYSGTVGAVIEGVFKGIPGIAFSCYDLKNPNFQEVKKYIIPIINYALENPLHKESFLNVNFPSKQHEIQGIKLARQGFSYSIENPDKRKHPEGHEYFWMGGKWDHAKEHEHSDIYYLKHGYGAVVPINLSELTCDVQFNKHKKNFEKKINALD